MTIEQMKYDLELELKEYIKYINALDDNHVEKEHQIIEYELGIRKKIAWIESNVTFFSMRIEKLKEVISNYKDYDYDICFLYAALSEMEYEEAGIYSETEAERIQLRYADYVDIHDYLTKYKATQAERKKYWEAKGFVFTI
jgi:hypothetical protein